MLAVNDMPDSLELMGQLLRQSGYRVLTASDGREGFEVARAEHPDLIISDVSMPLLDGIEMCRLIREHPGLRSTPVLLVSAIRRDSESMVEGLKAGADDYLEAPYDPVRLITKAARLIERKRAEEELSRSEERYRELVENALDIIYTHDLEGNYTSVNKAVERITGYTCEEALRLNLAQTVAPECLEKARRMIAGKLAGEKETVYDLEMIAKDGGRVSVEVNTRLIYQGGVPVGVQGIARDVTERKRVEEMVRQRTEELNHLAFHDALTDLPNRFLFEDRLTQALMLAQRDRRTVGVLTLSLDWFRKVNDTLGHAEGYRLLQEVAARLTDCVRDGATVARFEGDEFALLLAQIGGTEDVLEVIRRISEALKPPFTLGGQELFITLSVGISLYPNDGQDASTLLKNAGVALHRAKEQGGGNYQFYTADMNAKALQRLALENSLRRALERKQFEVYYQPRVDVGTGRIVGMEALVRWWHPELGLVPPAEFISLAEDTGLIVPMGEWVLRTACAQVKAWQEAGLTHLSVAVNLSARQFRQPNLSAMVIGILRETGFRPQDLELELTESSVMQNAEAAVRALGELKEAGVKIAIDDFGTGYSSLGYLKRLPVDMLKVDKSFVRDVTTDPDDAALVMAIITLAHNLRLKVVAEGVETEEQLRFLHLLGCDEWQGFLSSRPLTAEAFEELLLRGKA